ncbi:uncharacterized protein LOC496042 [Xenopus laevis]|uniref:LOC496042 protein n=1 Tax=Xenopus laevis TaxID=8355 RepID=Q5PPY7_XENLA|nr:uncharacterized protein LOC496042 [Xenopus laevis]AAH87437.1 LOC496042 protein [Xenopus laevis]
MAAYQLWSPWTPLDDHLQWLRQATPQKFSKHPFRGVWSSLYTTDVEKQACFHEIHINQDKVIKPGQSPHLARHLMHLKHVQSKVLKPQPVRLIGLDIVFGRMITIQPPKWTGSFRVSEKSAFSRVVIPKSEWPEGLKEAQTEMAIDTCKKLLRAILLLYATYKKCSFILQHSK